MRPSHVFDHRICGFLQADTKHSKLLSFKFEEYNAE